jgi:hypothetical protein
MIYIYMMTESGDDGDDVWANAQIAIIQYPGN